MAADSAPRSPQTQLQTHLPRSEHGLRQGWWTLPAL